MITVVPAIQRSPFTAAVLAALATTGLPVGDGKVPAGGQWVGGVDAPGSYYQPFVVASEINASHSSGPIGDPQADWQLPYLIECFGVDREQVGKVAERAMAALMPLQLTAIDVAYDSGVVHYGVQQVRLDSLGSPTRVDATQPEIWHSQGSVTLWIGKGSPS